MKKYFYLAAVSAMMLTACSSDKDVLEPTTTPSTPTVVAQQQAVAFDTYLSGTTASTRAGDPEGVMTTDKLKTANKGFGVFAYYADGGADYASSLTPNFMYNEQVSWANPNGGWTYSPLKYWPNETTQDSQSDPATATPADNKKLDKLSFFAYAPYVATGVTPLNSKTDDYLKRDATPANDIDAWTGVETSGITAISRESESYDPLVEWKYSNDIDKNVDLLWGVAAAGMDYTAVNGTHLPVVFGMPLLNLVKPNKDQKVKFLFQHALSRIGLSVVSSIDQIAAGDDGDKFKNGETRVLIEEVKVWGDFCTQGVLNLNNTAVNKANWVQASINKSNTLTTPGTPIYTFGNGETGAANAQITKDLRYISTDYVVGGGLDITGVTGASDAVKAANKFSALNKGVQTYETVLLTGGPDDGTKKVDPAFEYGTVLYKYNSTTKEYEIATTTSKTDADGYTKDGSGKYTQAYTSGASALVLDGNTYYYKLTNQSSQVASAAGDLDGTKNWYAQGGGAGTYTYTPVANPATVADGNTYYTFDEEPLGANNYAAGTYWSGLLPRYMMFVPSKTAEPTKIKVEIKYHVVTFDDKLNGWISNVGNDITKETEIQLESGKSYNLKLILGLTSVKLDAVVGDWQVGDDAEVWVPKNN